MKSSVTTYLFFAIGLSVLTFSGQASAQQSASKMRDSVKHDELSQKLRMAQQADPIRDLGPPAGNTEEDPAKAQAERDLVKTSTVFAYRGYLTLVPKRSVLHVPDVYAKRLEVQNGAKVQTWRDFYQSNRGWIRTMEVTREQALGHVPFSEETAAAIQDSSVVVIATYQGGPISVLPPMEEEEVPSRSEMKPTTFR